MLTAGSVWVTVGHTGTTPYFNIQNNQLLLGQVRWNPNLQCLEVYDGTVWHPKRDVTTVDLSSEAKELMEWIRVRRQREQQIDELVASHPALRDLHEQFEMMLKLVQQDEKD